MEPARGRLESDVRAALREHDRCWGALDVEALAAFWDLDDPLAVYMGDEYQEPVIGAHALARHWGRIGARLSRASVRSEPTIVNVLAEDLALVVMRVNWELIGVEGGAARSGRSWVTVVLRRRPAGWRFVHYMERLADVDVSGLTAANV